MTVSSLRGDATSTGSLRPRRTSDPPGSHFAASAPADATVRADARTRYAADLAASVRREASLTGRPITVYSKRRLVPTLPVTTSPEEHRLPDGEVCGYEEGDRCGHRRPSHQNRPPDSGELGRTQCHPHVGSLRFGPKGELSTTRGLMFQRRKEPRPTQESNRPLLRRVDNHRVIRLAIANERNDAIVARFRVAHDAVIAADRQGGHARIITAGCDGLPRQVRPRPTTASN